MNLANLQFEIHQADRLIRTHIRETPLEYSDYLSELGGCHVLLKLENLQYTGSFKVRGAMNKLLSLSPDQRTRGVVAASSGNHGVALAWGLRELQAPGLIFVPEDASPAKTATMRRLGTEVQAYGQDCLVSEMYARAYAERNDMVYISPYNDPQVIAGQGTIGVELMQQVDQIDAIFVALGGGGLIGGIGGYLKSNFQKVEVIGCSPSNSAAMHHSVRVGQIVDVISQPTLSDGTAGGLEPDAITFDLCRNVVDNYVLVSENEIREAMRLFIETHHLLIEGAAGVALAAFLKLKDRFSGGTVVIVICGANIGLKTLKRIL